MIFDDYRLPRDTGATDLQDSARLAGIMTVIGWPQRIPLDRYLAHYPARYVRHPQESIYDFSRDQAVCLMAGFGKLGQSIYVNADLIRGSDLLPPSVRGHIRRCQGLKANWFQDLWLKADILFNAYCVPLSESNQLICMMIIAGPSYVKLWTMSNEKWKQSIEDYWCGWRGEPELAAAMINYIEEYIK